MRIVLADDEGKVRSALRLLLEQEPDFQVVGETESVEGLLQAADKITPDVLLLDWELPGLPPEQLLRLLKLGFPSLKVMAMSAWPQAEQQAVAAGADAFLSKSKPPRQLPQTIRALFT